MKKPLITIAALTLIFTAQAGNKSWFDTFWHWGGYVSSIPHVINAFSYEDILEGCTDAGPHTQQFVKNLLALYYPEINTDHVHVLYSQHYMDVPFVLNDSGEFYLVVPITDRALLLALNVYLFAQGHEQIYVPSHYPLDGDGRGLFYPENELIILALREKCSVDFIRQVLSLKFQ